MDIEMKSIVQQYIASAIITEVMAPDYVEGAMLDTIRMTDDQLSARLSRAIRFCAVANAEIEAAFPSGRSSSEGR